MKEQSENETIILINDADMSQGYFSFYTSKKQTWDRLLKRIGRENITIRKEKDCCYEAKIPKKYLSRASFGIRKSLPIGKGRGNIDSLRKYRETQGSETKK